MPIQIRERLHERTSDSEPIADWPAFFREQWHDFSYTLSDGENLATVQERNILALQEILDVHRGETILIATHGTALLTILHFYDKVYDYDAFMRILPLTPFVVRCDFVGQELIAIHELGKPS